MPRQQRILSETGIYHVMMRGNERKNLFLDEADKQRFIETVFFKKKETGFHIYAYCLMDNHVHMALKEPPEGLASMMKRINTSYAYYFNEKHQRTGHLFQDRFKSEPIENDRYLLAVVRYIHNNPVKAGIVEEPDQYKWSSYHEYLSESNPNGNRVETALILSIMASDLKTAIEEFKAFSLVQEECRFIDIEDSRTWTWEEGKAYLDGYLKSRWSEKGLGELMNNKSTRTEVIADLKENTGLSVREIAGLLGINRGLVQKVKAGK